jgi:hypothetical protein
MKRPFLAALVKYIFPSNHPGGATNPAFSQALFNFQRTKGGYMHILKIKQEEQIMTTLKQAQYHAKRAAIVEFSAHMSSKNGHGVASRRFDSAEHSARLAYDAKLQEHGYDPIVDREDFRFLNSGKLIVEE